MTVSMFIILLTGFSTATGLVVQAIKKILDEKKCTYSSNLLACIVACVVGIGGTISYYIICQIPFNTINIVFIVLMGIATAVSAMVGYDKIIQTIKQMQKPQA